MKGQGEKDGPYDDGSIPSRSLRMRVTAHGRESGITRLRKLPCYQDFIFLLPTLCERKPLN